MFNALNTRHSPQRNRYGDYRFLSTMFNALNRAPGDVHGA